MNNSYNSLITACELVDCEFVRQTRLKILSKKAKGNGKKQNPSKYEGYKNSYMAQKTIIEREPGLMEKYYDTLIRPTLNLAKANRKNWQATLWQYDVDVETGVRGLGYLHHCFQSIFQYKQGSQHIKSLKSITALVSDLHNCYENEEKQIPTQGANLPLAIIENDRKIIFTTTPILELLRNWQIGVTFINISEEYSTWPAYWSLLAHEVCGHEIINGYYNILTGDNFLIGEIMKMISEIFTLKRSSANLNLVIQQNVRVNRRQVCVASESFMSDYFTNQTIFNETLASTMGYLNIGPAYGIALYSILGPLMECRWKLKSLLSIPENDEPYSLKLPYGVHPIGILHMVIGKACMNCIKELSGKSGRIFGHWIKFFEDLSQFEKGDNLFILTKSRKSKFIIPRDSIFRAVEEVVNKIVNSPLVSLTPLDSQVGRPIIDFGSWNSDDEKITRRLVAKLHKSPLKASNLSSVVDDSNVKARHVVAATTIASVMSNNTKKIDQLNCDALEILFQKQEKHPELVKPKPKSRLIAPLRMRPVRKQIKLPSIKAYGLSSLRSF